jgi:transposase
MLLKKLQRKSNGDTAQRTIIEKVDVWFQDEARIGQRGTVTRLWAIKGTRPRVIRQQQFEYAYIFGAVCPQTDQSVALVLPEVNITAMRLHLQQISASVPVGRHAVLVMDRAGWHTSKKIGVYENLSILPLPAASPELNPTEQVWRQLREDELANRCFDGYEDIVESSCRAWNNFIEKEGSVKKLCSRDWAIL